MIALKAGDKVKLTGKNWEQPTAYSVNRGDVVAVEESVGGGFSAAGAGELLTSEGTPYAGWEIEKVGDEPVVPAHYAFPGGIRVHQISGHLTSFGGQALQYIARSTRLDGQNKGDTAENLRKAIRFLELEIARVEQG